MSWRPTNWKDFWKRNPIYSECYNTICWAREFENGADAMLETLLEWGHEECPHSKCGRPQKRFCSECWDELRT